MFKKIVFILTLVIVYNGAIAGGQTRSVTAPVLLGVGIALSATGLVGFQSAASWTPLIVDQEKWADELRENGYDNSEAVELLSEFKSSRSNLRTISTACLSVGIVSAIIGIVKLEADRHVRLVPVVTKDEARLNLGYSF